jgi:hypothetical protein
MQGLQNDLLRKSLEKKVIQSQIKINLIGASRVIFFKFCTKKANEKESAQESRGSLHFSAQNDAAPQHLGLTLTNKSSKARVL